MKIGLNITTLFAVGLLAVGCTSEISVEHLNNLTSVISVTDSVECLWLPIEEGAYEAQVIAVGSDNRTAPLNIRLAQPRWITICPSH